MICAGRAKIAAFFIREKASGRLESTAHEEKLADFCIAMMQGAMLMGKVKRDSRLVEDVVRETMRHLDTMRRTGL